VAELAALYLRLAGARARSDFQYRASFVTFWLAQFLITFLDFVALLIIFDRIPQLDGWTLQEVALLYGISGVAFGLGDLFISQVEDISIRIRTGTFDLVLIRPLPTLFQVVADDFALRRMGKPAQALAVLVMALVSAPIDWDPLRALMVLIAVVSGAVIFSSLWIAGAAMTFWTTEGSEFMNAFTYGGNFSTQYPLSIYGDWMRRILGFTLGTAFVAYLPALYILDKSDPLHLPTGLRFASPLVAVVFAFVAGGLWRLAVRHYRSTGS
jgi:ABC-2 type transport system permease protein